MKKKTYTFKQEEKDKNAIYTQEIKNILINNPQIETAPGYDENGNYMITLMIPDWKDRWKIDSYKQNSGNEIVKKQYGNYQQARGYRSFNAR